MQKRDFPEGGPEQYPTPGLNLPPQMRPMPQPTPAKRRRHPVFSHAAVAAVALAIGAGIGSAGHNDNATSAQAGAAATSPASASTTRAASSTTPSAPASRKTTARATSAKTTSSIPTRVSGDGEYRVGVDMQAGTYRTAGPQDDSLGLCYWERDKNASGDFSAIIANNALSGSGIVTVKRGEYFKSTGCQAWVRVG